MIETGIFSIASKFGRGMHACGEANSNSKLEGSESADLSHSTARHILGLTCSSLHGDTLHFIPKSGHLRTS
ncbi:uncharacterized protein EI90DRAFT_3063017 [Cantharellus anzutake]|uniref:uncharacterized protein n=1 Tax=Cantharellus anzutake TaxID=1750568 RepID=UPI0019042FB4|nr:uncharacterized protein EI90DRAFT_3063017 [Cantharellus anzutake]KAF8329567.1 hypothetical protein EI90DRAFT_3063017 [Cantharellus anzutake]